MSLGKYKPQTFKSKRVFNSRASFKALYDGNWVKYRYRFLHYNPKCYACGETSSEVDHLVPHKGNEELFTRLDNHLPLCVSCHSTVTALFDANYQPGKPIDEKLSWLKKERALRGISLKVKVLSTYLSSRLR